MKETRTYADRAHYLVLAVQKRRKKIKNMAVKYKGGKCHFCGYNKCIEALDFHHIEENGEKNFSIGHKGYTRSWTRVKEELDKCILVCANCHREIHAGILQLPLETVE